MKEYTFTRRRIDEVFSLEPDCDHLFQEYTMQMIKERHMKYDPFTVPESGTKIDLSKYAEGINYVGIYAPAETPIIDSNPIEYSYNESFVTAYRNGINAIGANEIEAERALIEIETRINEINSGQS